MAWTFLRRFVLAFLGSLILQGEAPSIKPILRLETGTHLGKVARLATDASGRWLATASDDKTLRIWDLQTRSLVRTLRVPIGRGDEGDLYACALSPDGRLLVAGGWTGREWDGTYSVYVLDRASGSLLRRLTGLPDPVHSLAFSPDGRRLAICLGNQGGLRVLLTSDWSQAFGDKDYRERAISADFDSGGRLATAAWDGRIRLYAPDGRKLAEVEPMGGERPMTARFSPDGSRLAVGYADTSSVPVLAIPDLKTLFHADTTGLKGGVFALAWMQGGKALVGESRLPSTAPARPGQPPFDPPKVLRTWLQGGQGKPRDQVMPFRNHLVDLLPLPDGSLAMASFDGWGILSAEGLPWICLNAAGDFRTRILSIDPRGETLAFSMEFPAETTWRFDLASRTLAKGATGTLRPPRTQAPGLRILHWRNGSEPTLNDRRLPIKEHEMARALAIRGDGRGFLVGADRTLYAFDAQGRERWKRPVPGIAWAVNLTEDDRTAIVAYGDGTIRWHRVEDGKETLCLYVHPGTRRWVLWTPSGMYDASPGAEDLIGWHLNRTADQAADFFPASRFRDRYFQPDQIDRAITGAEDDSLMEKSSKTMAGPLEPEPPSIEDMLPPVVRILDPEHGARVQTTTVPIRIRVHHPRDLAVDEVWATLDGRALSMRGIAVKPAPKASGPGREMVLEIPVPPRDCLVSILARSGKAVSEAVTLPLRWAGASGTSRQGRLNILAVGVSDYRSPELKLAFAAKDARDVASRLLTQEGRLYPKVEVRMLQDEGASRPAIIEGLQWLAKGTSQEDTAVIFLAGHGRNDAHGRFYFLPYGADPARPEATLVSDTEIQQALATIPGRVVVFLDACHSGNVMRQASTRFVNELSSAESGVVVFTASTGRQFSLEGAAWNNGAFTKALTEGLDGQADLLKKGRITISTLDAWLADRVPALTDGQQTPTVIKPTSIPDFVLAVR